jgi:hypothetical protein
MALIIMVCALIRSPCTSLDLALESHAITRNRLQILKKTSQFAPLRKAIHLKSWEQTLELSTTIAIPLQALPKGFLDLPAPNFPLFCLRFLMQDLGTYQQENQGKRFLFRGDPTTLFERAHLDEGTQTAVYRLSDGSSIREVYFKDSKGRFRVRSQTIRWPVLIDQTPHIIQWKIEFLKFGYFPPGFETVKKLLPKRIP